MKALAFFASDEDRLSAFMGLTGLSVGDLSARAGERTFQIGVLEHLLSDESLLLAFCAEAGIAPEEPGRALMRLQR